METTENTTNHEQKDSSQIVLEKAELLSDLDIDWNFLKLLPWFDGVEIRSWFFSAKYFVNTAKMVEDIPDKEQQVVMQIFQKSSNAIIAWVEIVRNLVKLMSGYYKNETLASKLLERYMELKQESKILQEKMSLDNNFQDEAINKNVELLNIKKRLDALWVPAWNQVQVEICKKDGDISEKFAPVIKIIWPYKVFAKLESVYLWLLARTTKVATNTAKVVEAAKWKPVIFFADRFDYFGTQNIDGYAAMLGGAKWLATDAQAFALNKKWQWTMPHASIAIFDGDTAKATLEFAKKNPDVPLISLVDFDNNCTETAVRTAEFLKNHWYDLNAVRLDTSGSMVDEWLLMSSILEENFSDKECQLIRDEYLFNKENDVVINNSLFSEDTLKILKEAWLTGVCIPLVNLVRQKLDEAGFFNIKIFVSWWFTAEKIQKFEQTRVPVDWYGIWSTLLTPKYVSDNWDFTADIVNVNWTPVSKKWRKEYF